MATGRSRRCRRGIDIVRVKAELIVDLALLGIAQNVVGFGEGFELLFRDFVARIDVRMIFARQPAVRLLDLVRGDIWILAIFHEAGSMVVTNKLYECRDIR